jgi:hypothetical protein
MAEDKKVLKVKDVSPSLIKRIENSYGPLDPENDFFTLDLDTYYKTSSVNKTTGSVSHDVIKLASFGDSLEKISNALKALKSLMKSDEAGKDQNIQDVARELKDTFNKYRTHLRKNYPDQYDDIKRQLEEMSTTGGGAGSASFTGGTGMQYATPYAFRMKGKKPNDKAYKELGYTVVKEDEISSYEQRMINQIKRAKADNKPIYNLPIKTQEYYRKNKDKVDNFLKEGIGAHLGPGPKASNDGVKDNAYVKQFKYKLVPKKIKGSGLEVKQLFEVESAQEFQNKRIKAFDVIERELNDIYKMLSNAKNETSDYYNDNPSSYSVIKPTDLVLDYIKDIKSLLKGE